MEEVLAVFHRGIEVLFPWNAEVGKFELLSSLPSLPTGTLPKGTHGIQFIMESSYRIYTI